MEVMKEGNHGLLMDSQLELRQCHLYGWRRCTFRAVRKEDVMG